MKTTALTFAALAATATAALPAAADAKKPKYEKRQFEVRVLGTQETRWGTLSDDHADTCRTKTTGSGRERWVFHTRRARPHKLTLFASRNLSFYSFGNLSIDATGFVTRDGYERTTVEDPCPPVAEGDPDSGPGDAPPAPDCGEKDAPSRLALHFTRETVELESEGGDDELFLNCPVRGLAYAQMLTLDGQPGGGAKPIKAKLKLRDLVRSKKRVFEVSGRGSLVDNYADTSTSTKIGWTIKLTRIGGKKKRG